MEPTLNHIDQMMIGHHVGQASIAIRHAFMVYLKQEGMNLTPEQFIVLKRVYRKKQMTQNEIATYFLRDNASITRVLDSLEKKNLIERVRSKEDRRVNFVHVTDEGESFLKGLFPLAGKLNHLLLENVLPEEVEQLKHVLDKIFQNALKISGQKNCELQLNHHNGKEKQTL